MSITEIEYRTALANNLPVLLYLVSNDYAVKPDSVETGKNAKKIQKLRTEILGRHTIQFFSTPEDLSRLVATDLHKALRNPKEKKIDTTSSFDLNSPVPAEVNPAHPFLLCHQYKPSFTKEYFDVKLYIDLYDESYEETFPKIDKVIYQLHESFVLPVIPMQNWQEYFLLHMRVWGEFWVRAIIFFKDKKKPPIALLRYINLKLPDALEGK